MRIPLTERNLPNYTKGEEIFHERPTLRAASSHSSRFYFASSSLHLRQCLGDQHLDRPTPYMIVLYCLFSVYTG
jgi:hypothetical protein